MERKPYEPPTIEVIELANTPALLYTSPTDWNGGGEENYGTGI